MLLIPILAGVFAGIAIGATWASHQGRRRRFNAIVEGTEARDGTVLYRGVYYEVPDDDRPLPEDDASVI